MDLLHGTGGDLWHWQAVNPKRRGPSKSSRQGGTVSFGFDVPCEILNAFRPLLLHLEIRSRYLGTLVSYFGTT